MLLKKIVLWIALLVGIALLVALAVNSYFAWNYGRQIAQRLKAIRDAGDPAVAADLARPPVSPDKNAVTWLRRAEQDVSAIDKLLQDVSSSETYVNALPTDAERKKLEEAFAAHPQVIQLLEQAAACPEYDPKHNYSQPVDSVQNQSMNGSCQRNRSAARTLQARAVLLIAQGKRDEAVGNTITLYKLTGHFSREPFLVGQLVAVACRSVATQTANRALQAGPVSPAVRAALEAELARQDPMEGYRWALKTDRVYGMEMFDKIPMANSWLGGGYWGGAKVEYLDALEQELAATSLSYQQARQNQAAPSNALVRLLVPSLQAARVAVGRNLAEIRCLRVLNAIQSKVPPDGKEVPALTSLGLPADATTDPFNGEPLRVKRLPEGWLIYSVGENLRDDGGEKLDGVTDAGIGPVRKEGGTPLGKQK